MNTRTRPTPLKAESLDTLLPQLDTDWYRSTLDYGYPGLVPTFGPRTPLVEALINRSNQDWDIVSWDTTSPDPDEHRYLLREWTEVHNSHSFAIYGLDEMIENFPNLCMKIPLSKL